MEAMLIAANTRPSSALSDGLLALGALLFVCALAALVLRLLARRGVGMPHRAPETEADAITVLSTRTLARGQRVHLLRVHGRLLLVGTGASGEPPRLIGEVPGVAQGGAGGEDARVGDGNDGD